MEKTFEDKVLERLVEKPGKHKCIQILLYACASVTLFVYRIFAFFSANGKRLVSLAVILLIFTVSSSFSFPVFSEGFNKEAAAEGGQEEIAEEDPAEKITPKQEYVYDPQLELVSEERIQPEAVEILDDDDVLEGYEDAELHGMEDADRYTLDEILEENNYYSGTVRTAASEGGEAVFDKDDWKLVLINKQHPIPEDYTFTLGTIKGGMKCDERIISDLLDMFQAAKEDGINLEVCSPYRDMSRQEMLFNKKIKTYMGKGMSYMEAYSYASQAVTVPGASEHQIGLAIDIVCDTYHSLNEGFADTEAGKWLAEYSCEYGFTLRYPSGKEYITGIEYEPWHFRYVGRDAAVVMKEEGLCLEEFVESL